MTGTCYEPLSPLSFLRRSAAVFPDKTAVVHRDKRYSYSEFHARVNRLASALRKEGVTRGDKVAFICPNIPPMLEAHYGVPLLGAALVSVNIRDAAGGASLDGPEYEEFLAGGSPDPKRWSSGNCPKRPRARS